MIICKARHARMHYQLKRGQPVTIKEVAEAIGTPRPTLSRIETHKSQPTLETIEKLCRFYGLQPGELLELTDE